MAKFTANKLLSSYKDSFDTKHMKRLAKRPNDAVFSKNQYSLTLQRKPKSPRRRTKAQALLRDRFAQVECMWKYLTKGQRLAFISYIKENYESDMKTRRPYDIFKSVGMKYELEEFLKDKLKLKLTLSIVEATRKGVKIACYYTSDEEVEIDIEALQILRTARG